jgi:uncharacterized protein YbjT (DUF2867 family)
MMQAANRIAVAGATGRVGHHVVEVLRAQGHDVVPMSRSTGVDVISGAGLADALDGVTFVIDAATGPSPDEREATAFFTTAAHNLHDVGERAGVQGIAAVSIIGTDRFTAGYGVAKQAHERAHLSGAIPARILRASQFHEFVAQLVDWGRDGEVSRVPLMRTQLVAARTVAEALAEMATHPEHQSAGDARISEIAGPREERLADMARFLIARRGDSVRIEEASNPDDPDGDLNENGGLLPGPGATLAGPTFEEWVNGAS